MAVYYFDASALVKYYILEPGSAWVRGLVKALTPDGRSRANVVLIAEASRTEGASAFAILHRTARIGRRARDGAFKALVYDIATGVFSVAPVLTTDFHLAAYLTQRHPLKAYDAIQLAVGLRQSQVLAGQDLILTFVGGDHTQLLAAQAEGLTTDNPFDHVSSADPPRHAG
jgi:predicted nucleic acid-binding protein